MNFAGFGFARRMAVVVVACVAAVCSQAALAQKDPLAGTWKLLTDRSVFGAGSPQFKELTLNFGAGDVMTLQGKDADGKDVKASFTAIPDGKQHPITGMSAYTAGTWTKVNDNTVTYQYFRGRNLVAMGSRTVTPDGTSLTFQEKALDARGNQTSASLIIFDNPDARLASLQQQQQQAVAPKPVFTPEETSALALLDKNDNDGAISALSTIINGKPTPMLYYDHVSRGVAYLRKGQEDQAMADFDAAVKLKPDDADAHMRRAAIKFQHMDWPAAIDDLSAAIQSDPMNADAYNMRSFSYYRLMQNDKGAADTEKACSLKKEYCVN